MKQRKLILFSLGTLSLILSLYWGISGNQLIEPWTVTISCLLFVIGLIMPQEQDDKKAGQEITQTNIFSKNNSSRAKKGQKSNQKNIFSANNEQEIN